MTFSRQQKYFSGQKSVTRLLCYGMVDLAMRSSLVLWTEGQGAYIYDGKATLYTSQMMSFTVSCICQAP